MKMRDVSTTAKYVAYKAAVTQKCESGLITKGEMNRMHAEAAKWRAAQLGYKRVVREGLDAVIGKRQRAVVVKKKSR
jgi:hypothetical protein